MIDAMPFWGVPVLLLVMAFILTLLFTRIPTVDCEGTRPDCRLCPPCANCGRQKDCPRCGGSMCTVHRGRG